MLRYKPRPRTNIGIQQDIVWPLVNEALSNKASFAGDSAVGVSWTEAGSLQYAHGYHVISFHCRVGLVGLEWTHSESIIFQLPVSGKSNARPTL